jgi:hypothetical protein
MKFRRVEQLASHGNFTCRQVKLYTAAWFKYPRITLPTNGTAFTRNIQDRAVAVIRTTFDVQSVTALPASTALLKLKIFPAATYGIALIRQDLAEIYKNKVESAIAAF